MLASRQVHHLGVACQGVPLYVQWLAGFLTTKEGSGGLKVIVVAHPCHAGPAGVAHPDEQAHAVFRSRLVHSTIALIVFPLSQLGKLLCVLGLSEGVGNDVVERSTTLSTLHGVVVLSPSLGLWPQGGGRKGTHQALIGHHVRHTTLRVQLARLT